MSVFLETSELPVSSGQSLRNGGNNPEKAEEVREAEQQTARISLQEA